jgi:hypothetical protein
MECDFFLKSQKNRCKAFPCPKQGDRIEVLRQKSKRLIGKLRFSVISLQSTLSRDLNSLVWDQLEKIAESNPDFREAFDSYIQQYGHDKIRASEPTELGSFIDPLVLILGRNCVLSYDDSAKRLKGNLGSVTAFPGDMYVLGRREPQDSKLIAWHPSGATELQEYSSRVDTIPSRIHGLFASLEKDRTIYTDLGSSAGTIVVGQSKNLGAVVRVYDPGQGDSGSVKLQRVFTANSF